MTFSKKATILSLTTIVALALAACSNGNSQTQPSQASQANSSVSSSSTSSSASSSSSASTSASTSSATTTTSTELDGTYTATHEGDQLTLTISSGKGTLTTLERDGEKEIEQVEIDSTNQRMIIGDDVHRYYINGNQLTVEDIDQEQDQDDTIVFTKQSGFTRLGYPVLFFYIYQKTSLFLLDLLRRPRYT